MADRLVLLGGGGHAAVVAEAAAASGSWDVVGFVAPTASDGAERPRDLVWLGTDDDFLAPDGRGREPATRLIAAFVGPTPEYRALRKALVARYEAAGASFAIVVHPTAWVSSTARLLPGTVVLAGASVNAGALVGSHAILNSHAVVEHHVTVGDHAHVGPGAIVGGGASVASGASIGLGALVRDHVSVGRDAVVGMGAVVVADVPDGTVVVGNPARARSEA
ncbi:MAG TPA: NeuD/PglB/VioB family sugar acetyltransferase [Candidatus Limnocylindrales bacterium]